MNQWIERAVQEATEERQRILDGIQSELADVARIDAAILALTGTAPPSPLTAEPPPAPARAPAPTAEPAPAPAAPEPEPAPEPPTPKRPVRPPAPPRPAPSLAVEGQATPAMIQAALQRATGPRSTREVLAAIQQEHPEIVGLGNALAESVEEGLIERLDGRAPDGFPVLSLSTAAPPAPAPAPAPEAKPEPATPKAKPEPKSKPVQPKRAMPGPVSPERLAKARERWDAVRDYLEEHGPTPRREVAKALDIPDGSWGTVNSAGTLLKGLADAHGIRSEVVEVEKRQGRGAPRLSYLLLPGQELPTDAGKASGGKQNGQVQVDADVLSLMPALKDKENPLPVAHEAAVKQLEVWNAIRAYGQPFTVLDLLATGLEQSDRMVKDYLKAFKDLGYIRATGERRRNTERDGAGKPPDVLEVCEGAPPGSEPRPKPSEAKARPTDGAAGTTAPLEDTSKLSLEIVRDCSREMEGEFSPAQMVAMLERKYERMNVSFQTVEGYLKTLAERGTLTDISPTADMPLYEYSKPTGPGRAAELDAQRRGTMGPPPTRGGPVPGSGKPGSAGSGKVDRLLRAVERAGGSWRRSGSGHFLITLSDNRRATIAATPSETSHRSDVLKLRKLGVAV